MQNVLAALGLIIVLGVGFTFYIANVLGPLRQRCLGADANLGVVVKKRQQLAERLFSIAERHVSHEQLVHLGISKDRSHVTSGAGLQTAAIGFVFAGIADSFPELRANATFQSLTTELTSVEHEVQAKAEAYNALATEYNSIISLFPVNVVAPSLGFREAPYNSVARTLG